MLWSAKISLVFLMALNPHRIWTKATLNSSQHVMQAHHKLWQKMAAWVFTPKKMQERECGKQPTIVGTKTHSTSAIRDLYQFLDEDSEEGGADWEAEFLFKIKLSWNCQMLQHLKILQQQHWCMTCWVMLKNLKMCQILVKKMHFRGCFFLFSVMYSSCPKAFKNEKI